MVVLKSQLRRRSRSSSSSSVWTNMTRFLLLPSLLLHSAAAGRRVIYLEDFPNLAYIGQVADFGDPMDTTVTVDLVGPPEPEEYTLCRFPPSLENATSAELQERFPNRFAATPIAILVSVGECSPQRKAEVALELQTRLSRMVRYLIIYERNRDFGSSLFELKPDSRPVGNQFDRMGLIYLPYSQVGSLARRVSAKQEDLLASPLLFQDNNNEWHLKATIEETFYSYPDGQIDHGFSWFRFVLFSLLIMSPCCRAGYLWYSGGGRFHFRRNDRGLITGVMIVPPVPYWLSQGGPTQPLHSTSLKMTEEEFDALPEITYVRPIGEGESESNNDNSSPVDEDYVYVTPVGQGESESELVDEADYDPSRTDGSVGAGVGSGAVAAATTTTTTASSTQSAGPATAKIAAPSSSSSSSGTTTESQVAIDDGMEDNNTSGSDSPISFSKKVDSSKIDVELPGTLHEKPPTEIPKPGDALSALTPQESAQTGTTAASSVVAATTATEMSTVPDMSSNATTANTPETTCTMCSICIDDFEDGEKLTLLPRCRHAFHKECIKPWLMERQGCCPLCKTQVHNTTETDGSDQSSNSSGWSSSPSSNNNNNSNENNHEAQRDPFSSFSSRNV